MRIAESAHSNSRPDTAAELTALHEQLLVECEDSIEISGAGYSGSEARGSTHYWGTTDHGSTWSVYVINAEAQ